MSIGNIAGFLIGFAAISILGMLFCAAIIGLYANSAGELPKPNPLWAVSGAGGIAIAAGIVWMGLR